MKVHSTTVAKSGDGKPRRYFQHFARGFTIACDGKCGKAWGIGNRPCWQSMSPPTRWTPKART